MAFERTRFNDYYGLTKSTFSIDPVKDAAVYFGTGRLSNRITDRIEGDFAQARGVPKFFVLGDYGSGKTHTLSHIAHELKNNLLEAVEPIYVDIAPLRHKEKFATLQGRLMDAIGLDAIAAAAEAYCTNVKGDKATGLRDLLAFGDSALKSSQSSVFRNLLFGGRQQQLSWDWLKGATLAGTDREMLQVQKSLSQANEFVAVLLNTALLYKAGLGKTLVFLLDEGEAIRDVTDSDSVSELIFAFRELLDDSNNVMGLIVAIQPEGGEIGEFFSDPALYRRIGYDSGVFDLTSLVSEPLDVQKFVNDLLSWLIDRAKANEWCASEALECLPEHFPFSEDALRVLEEGVQNDFNLKKPAGIIHIMASAAIEGWRKRMLSESHVVVTAEMMESVLYPGR